MNCQPKRLESAHFGQETLVCWSRMQAEAGQGLRHIVARKELERRAAGGLFFWGVGNAPGSAPSQLAREQVGVEVVFSVMKSRPKAQDASAEELDVWRGYMDEFGEEHALPAGVLITSRAPKVGSKTRGHYALMCRRDMPIALGDLGPFNPKAFRSVGGRGAPVGASQVTALLRLTDPTAADDASYRANIRAKLVGGYWVRLTSPVRLRPATAKPLLARLRDVDGLSNGKWIELVAALRHGAARHERAPNLLDCINGKFANSAPLI